MNNSFSTVILSQNNENSSKSNVFITQCPIDVMTQISKFYNSTSEKHFNDNAYVDLINQTT